MNIQSINNVSDLIAQNEQTKSPFEIAVDALCEVNYTDSHKVAMWLVQNMLDFHKQHAVECHEDPEQGSALAWAHDAGKLEAILDTLKSID